MKSLNSAWPMVAVVLLLPAARGQEQPPATTRPQFEVASIKMNPGCENAHRRYGSISPSPDRLEMPCENLKSLIRTAYGTFRDGVTINRQPLYVEGGPSWAQSAFYSLSAKSEGPTRKEMLAGPMLQTLLEERFRLKIHREIREVPVYAMSVGKGGLKVQPLAEGACTPLDLQHPPPPAKLGDPPRNICGSMKMSVIATGGFDMEVHGSTMPQFAQQISPLVTRPVIDKTGVQGKFNLHLAFALNPNMAGEGSPGGRAPDAGNTANPSNPPPPPEPGPDLFVAVQEQIGLKLSSDKGPIVFLIIDHVEKPTAN